MTDRTEHRVGQSNNIVLVSLIAGMAGAAIGMLFAPRSGRETRERLKSTAEDMRSQARQGYRSARGTLEQGVDQARKAKDELTDVASKASNRIKSDAKDTARDTRRAVDNAKEEE
ncbi:MAG: YtxH-like protein [Candidatus Saccharibacteria bacterium]|nr:YtxH-like protein [Candidatus Saccharibacteria bacterium]